MGHDTGTGGGRLRICAESAGAEDPAERQPRLLVGLKKKMDDFFTAHGFNTPHILHNNPTMPSDSNGICGTRGWVSMQGEAADAKRPGKRSAVASGFIQSAVDAGLEPIVFYYPPIYGTSMNYEILEVFASIRSGSAIMACARKSGHNHAFVESLKAQKCE